MFYKKNFIDKGRNVWKLIFILFALCFLYSSVTWIRNTAKGKQEEQAFVMLQQSIGESSNTESLSIENRNPSQAEKYAALSAQNPDYVGWLQVPGTKIDYPVMYTPNDPEYYLRRSFTQATSASGCPFIGAGGSVDTDCFIIYGHNMDNGTMFGTLDLYQEKSFWLEHPQISFYVAGQERKYEVFAAAQARVLFTDEPGFRYYQSAGDLSVDAYQALIGWLQENAIYDTGIEPLYAEQILILSTCSYHTENGRFLIAARLLTD